MTEKVNAYVLTTTSSNWTFKVFYFYFSHDIFVSYLLVSNKYMEFLSIFFLNPDLDFGHYDYYYFKSLLSYCWHAILETVQITTPHPPISWPAAFDCHMSLFCIVKS